MNERRRTLLFSGGYKIPTENGIYIESVDHDFYLPDDWNSANTANSIAVVTDAHRFRIGLHDIVSTNMDNNSYAAWDTWLSGTTNSGTTNMTVAKTDYSGAVNTQLIVTKCRPNGESASSVCYGYTFPDGVTKGYLPALGELYLVYQNLSVIQPALLVVRGGTLFKSAWYWSSTFYYSNGSDRGCWVFNWDDPRVVTYSFLGDYNYVRPFALLEDSN